MEQNKRINSIPELNQRWWYRLVKVVYIIMFCIVVIGGISIIYEDNYEHQVFDDENSYVLCDDGRKLGLEENNVHIYSPYLYSYQEQTFRDLCAYNPLDPININPDNYSDLKRLHPTINNFKLVSLYKTEGGNMRVLNYSILMLIITLLIFELVKRIFYYIVLGTLKPRKV